MSELPSAKGGRPLFLETPALDDLLAVVVALAQEVAVLADRLDVSEEITRLAAHLDRLDEAAAAEGEAGKRLDFLIQEAFREINTCGNKAQDVEMSRLTVEFKVELEKCREQVQNIE